MSNRAKRYKKEDNRKNIITNLFLLIFLSLIIYSGIKIISYIIDAKQNEKIDNYIEESIKVDKNQEGNNNLEGKYEIDFEKLKQKNSDTCRIY